MLPEGEKQPPLKQTLSFIKRWEMSLFYQWLCRETAGGLFEIIKRDLPAIKQKLVSVCWYLWSLSPDGACLWELSHTDLIAVSCLKGDLGIKSAPGSASPSPPASLSLSLHYTPKAHPFYFYRQSICLLKTCFVKSC